MYPMDNLTELLVAEGSLHTVRLKQKSKTKRKKKMAATSILYGDENCRDFQNPHGIGIASGCPRAIVDVILCHAGHNKVKIAMSVAVLKELNYNIFGDI